MALATVTSKGQITIPREIRRLLNLESGDRVDFIIDENGRVIMEPATIDISELRGCLHKSGMKAVSTADMKRVIRERFKKTGRP